MNKREQEAADRRDSVRSVIEILGLHGGLLWAEKMLNGAITGQSLRGAEIRRNMIALAKECSDRLLIDIRRVRRLARAHTAGLRRLAEAEKQRTTARRVRRLTR